MKNTNCDNLDQKEKNNSKQTGSAQGHLFQVAMEQRPANYNNLSSHQQWQVDEDLDILNWDGSCPHQDGCPCKDCMDIYNKKYGKKKNAKEK